ncbi:hypothetical protein B0I35DRAFT_428264, partial [Stachybotrys elegans]
MSMKIHSMGILPSPSLKLTCMQAGYHVKRGTKSGPIASSPSTSTHLHTADHHILHSPQVWFALLNTPNLSLLLYFCLWFLSSVKVGIKCSTAQQRPRQRKQKDG